MKKSVYFIVAILFALAAKVEAASLIVSETHHETFYVYINGVLQNNSPVESICISGLAAGNYKIRIEQVSPVRAVTVMNHTIYNGNNYFTVDYRKNNNYLGFVRTNRVLAYHFSVPFLRPAPRPHPMPLHNPAPRPMPGHGHNAHPAHPTPGHPGTPNHPNGPNHNHNGGNHGNGNNHPTTHGHR